MLKALSADEGLDAMSPRLLSSDASLRNLRTESIYETVSMKKHETELILPFLQLTVSYRS